MMEEYCSVYTAVAGVKFYPGLLELHLMMHVIVEREPSNRVDFNVILVVTRSGNILDHLKRETAAVLGIGCLNFLLKHTIYS